MTQVGRLRYEATAPAEKTGTYVATIIDAKTGETLGEGHTTIGYSPEWKPGGDASTARRLSQMTGGTVLATLSDLPPLAAPTPFQGDRHLEFLELPQHNLAYILLALAAVVFLVTTLR